MLVVFLDIDGVLNKFGKPLLQSKSHGKKGGRFGIYECRVAILNKIFEAFPDKDIRLVISSTWRILNSQEKLEEAFNQAGFLGIFHPHGTTPIHFSRWREYEIADWLQKHGKYVENYVVIDDESKDLQRLKRRLVLVNHRVGLQQQDVEKAIDLLTKML